MAFSVGIIGFPNAGKSTLFKVLTKQTVKIEPRPFTTISPNVGIAPVPDKRLNEIARIIKPKKTTLAAIEFWDIAGLVPGAHLGQGLGNKFLAQIRNCKALIEVVRGFGNKEISHIQRDVSPNRDIEIIKTELLMKDLETVEQALSKLKKKKQDRATEKKTKILEEAKSALLKEKRLADSNLTDEQRAQIKEFQFLTQKPLVYLLNTGERNKELETEVTPLLRINLKLEEEIIELSEQEKKELELKSKIPELILACYKALNLITFYTIAGGKEAKAWILKKGQNAAKAGGIVHSDFENKFIRAEALNAEKLIQAQSWKKAKDKGQIEIVGRDYIVQDGDILEFKI